MAGAPLRNRAHARTRRPAGGRDPVPTRERVALPAAALTTAGWAVLMILGPIAGIALVVWVAENRSGAPAGDALRLATDGWLLAHGVRLTTSSGPIGLAPLLLSAAIFRQLYRAGRSTALATGVTSWPSVARVAAAIAVAYGLFGVAAALLGATATVRVDPGAAGLTTGALAALAAGSGAARTAGLGSVSTARLPDVVRRGALAGAVAGAAVLTAGVVAAAAQIIVTQAEFRRVFASLQGGVVGGVAIVALCILYAPTAAIWASAYLIGPGFAVGVGTSVDASSVVLTPLPSFPLLAAVPTGPASAMVSLVLATPLIAGLLAGAVTARPSRGTPEVLPRWRIALGGALVAGPVAGILVGLATAAATGPLGDGRLAELGPSGWNVAIVLAVEVAVAALVGATVARTLASWSAWSSSRHSAASERGKRVPPVLRRLGHVLLDAGSPPAPAPSPRTPARPTEEPADDGIAPADASAAAEPAE